MNLSMSTRLLGLGLLVSLAACGGEKSAQADVASTDAVPASDAAAPAAAPAGNVIVVKTETDDEGNNKFEPSHISAKKGDVIRFTLESGVHNFHFTGGPAGATLPAIGGYLQAPGQTEDLVVDLPPGEYQFQCDPHAALGMTGTLTVTE